ncbi:hypothetical protein [Alienimonas chondri]|uniref:Uncharacterized protein n=1 Tax=Alienimonas chondri TaxID=2681879 RepID=A0ABX1VH07_9PLAN|nr:hypothetical protein [Alienimonas chondri]NNJ27356.1 hypothetical protein [Alienimonas chondri]
MFAPPLSRRSFVGGSLAGAASLALPRIGRGETGVKNAAVPVRKLTDGPKQHWFGYYDKLQFSPDDALVLSNEIDFEGRSPTAEDSIGVGFVDRTTGGGYRPLGRSAAFGWQQGCMLQFRPGHGTEVLWNDRDGDRFVCRLDGISTDPVETGPRMRTIPEPIYTVAPDGKTGLNADFRRINDLRPGYGYAGLPDPHADELVPEESGVRSVNLDTGESELIFSIAQAAAIEPRQASMDGAKHYFNHLLYSPNGERFIVLHRWRPDGGKGGFQTRMFTVNADGSEPYVLDPSGHTSHFIWRDPDHICAWSKPAGKPWGFYLFKDRTDEVTAVGAEAMPANGHNTYLPDPPNANWAPGEWILNDTYPQGSDRLQTVYLYHVPTDKRVNLASFHSPPAYKGEWRCDTHPRVSRDGRTVCVDSPHDGGRQLYELDISGIVG